MERLTRSELEQMFIEMVQDCYEDDTFTLFGCTYSKIEMLKDHDPICFSMAMDEWLDSQVEDELLIERDGDYYQVA